MKYDLEKDPILCEVLLSFLIFLHVSLSFSTSGHHKICLAVVYNLAQQNIGLFGPHCNQESFIKVDHWFLIRDTK